MQRIITIETKDYAGNIAVKRFSEFEKASIYIIKNSTNPSMKRIRIWMAKHPTKVPLDTAADSPS